MIVSSAAAPENKGGLQLSGERLAVIGNATTARAHAEPAAQSLMEVVASMLGYSYWLVVWNPLSLGPSNGVFGRSDLAALLRLPHLKCLFVCLLFCAGHVVCSCLFRGGGPLDLGSA